LLDNEQFVANVTGILVAGLAQDNDIDMRLAGGLQRIGQLEL
jgi:hypothetical protein